MPLEAVQIAPDSCKELQMTLTSRKIPHHIKSECSRSTSTHMHRKDAKGNDTLLTAQSSKGNSAYYECSVSIGALVDAV